jgi:Flp pilus assembly protein TadD
MSPYDQALQFISQKNFLQAADCLQTHLKQNPRDLNGLNYLSFVLLKLDQKDQAIDCARQALQLDPTNPALWNNLSLLFLELDFWNESEQAAKESLKLKSDQALPLEFLSQSLIAQGRAAEAADIIRKWQIFERSDPEMDYRMGTAQMMLGNYKSAEECLRKTVAAKPNYHQAITNLGVSLRYQGLYKEALTCFQKAVQLNPEYPTARLNRATSWLLMGNYVQGWPEFEHRYLTHRVIQHAYPRPLWNGENFENKTLLIHAEQGLGDSLQFARYFPLVKSRGGRVIFECQESLLNWFKNHPGLDDVTEQDKPMRDYDLQIPLFCLPRIFETRVESIPPVVFPSHHFKQHENPKQPPQKIGFVWAGNPNHADDRERSCKLEHFLKVREAFEAEWICLQKNMSDTDQKTIEKHFVPNGVQKCNDLLDTARVIMNMDLVITVDTSVAHLAGTLMKPTWILIAIPQDWRWLLNRNDSPWYPTVRLFRQKEQRNWESVFNEILKELKNLSHS